nr:nodulin-like protein [Arabidopsis thaliana]
MACMKKALPFILMVLLQIGYAGMDILTKDVLNKGMSIYVLSVYRHGVATVVMAPFAFYFDNPVIAQNLFNLGMKYTTATFAIALYNTLPAVTFILALIFRLESVKFQSVRSAAKVVGTVTTVGGIMVMTLVKGPALDLFWTKGPSAQNTVGTDIHSSIKGAVLVTIGCFSYACFMILQAITLKTYPAELSLATWICLIGTIEGVVVALVMEKGNPSVWAIGWDTKLLTITYSGIVCSALGYYIGGVVMKTRGPVFVTAFKPLCMIVVAIMSSIIFDEQMYLGRALGATVICVGLYLVIWGKAKDYEYPSTPQIDDDLAQATTSKQKEQRRTVIESV